MTATGSGTPTAPRFAGCPLADELHPLEIAAERSAIESARRMKMTTRDKSKRFLPHENVDDPYTVVTEQNYNFLDGNSHEARHHEAPLRRRHRHGLPAADDCRSLWWLLALGSLATALIL
jgi:hypothetical protein